MKYLLAIASFVLSLNLFAQADVTLVAAGEREVEKAYRITTSPKIIDTMLPSPVVEYPLKSVKMETTTEIEKINPAKINTKEKLSKLYNTYVKLGIGSEFMPLGEVYFDSKRSRKYVYGAHVKHLSSYGNITGYAPSTFDRTRSLIYGGINERKYTLLGDIHYNNKGLHYYALPVDTLIADSIAQRYQDIGFNASYAYHKKDSAKVNFKAGIDYNYFASKKPSGTSREDWRAKENYFAVNTNWKYKLKNEVFATDFNVRYNGYKYGIEDSSLTGLDSGIVLNNTVINLKPNITTQLKDDRFKAYIGADIVFDIHTKTRVHVYPLAEVKYSMFNDIFIPYVGVRGGLKQNTFKSLTGINEFLMPNVNMENESTPIDFYGGIKGTLSKRISFNAGISFANVKNKALFITDTVYSMGNQFAVIFDTMNITSIHGSISYQLNEKLKVDGIGRFNSYSMTNTNNTYAWNLPQLQFILRGHYNLFDKFMFNLDLDIEQGRKALVYEPGDDVVLEDGQLVKTLNFITDANLSVEYRYNKRISAFIQANNIASVRYQRWYNAPVHSFQVLGGITYRF